MKYLYMFIIIFFTGCSTLNKDVELYNIFEKHKQSSSENKVYSKYFSSTITDKINNKNKSQLLFSKYMFKELSHFESSSGNRGCLTINGLSTKNEAVAFYLEYKNENGKWLISDIDVSFLEGVKNHHSKTLCPKEIRIE